MTVRLLVDQVILIHQEHVAAGPLLHFDKLDGAVAAPFQDVFGHELYPTLVLKAVKLIDGISRAQAFQDGNKRLAWLSGMALLQINGLFLQDLPAEEAADFVLNMDGGEDGLREAARWMNDRIVTLS